MDFFASQERARKKTTLLVVYFALAVVGIIASVYFLLFFLGFHTLGIERDSAAAVAAAGSLWQPEMLGVAAGGVSLLVGIGSGVKTMQLSSGGGVVARDLGGRLLDPATTDLAEKKLMNVVEEMALASGAPVPEVYVMDQERGINAFAAGKSPTDSAIGVTRGCIESLSRDELQGVIAHEFSHILNGDMRISTRLIGLLQGILILAIIGQILLRASFWTGGSSRDSKGGAIPILLLGLGLLVIGYIGVFFGKLIKAAISRQREFLADASAVQFTRNPDGIGDALKKIGGLHSGSRIESPRAEEASHMFFANGMRASFLGMLAPHPPLPQRIRALDPQWDGEYLQVTRVADRQPTRSSADAATPPPLPFPFPGSAGDSMAFPPFDQGGIIGAATGAVILAEAAGMRDDLLASIDVHEAPNAIAMIYTLLLSNEPALRARQLDHLMQNSPAAVTAALPVAQQTFENLDQDRKLPLVDLCIPALRQLSAPQYDSFRADIEYLITSDQQIDLFEFCLKAILERRLDTFHKGAEKAVANIRKAADARAEIQLLLSALTHLSGSSAPLETFTAATKRINAVGVDWQLLPLDQCGVDAIDSSLQKLSGAMPMVKKNLLFACGQLVMEDQHVTRSELRLLRAIAELLDVPIPPFVKTSG